VTDTQRGLLPTIVIKHHRNDENFGLLWSQTPTPEILRRLYEPRLGVDVMLLRAHPNFVTRYMLVDISDHHTFAYHVNAINVQRALLGLLLRARRDLGMST